MSFAEVVPLEALLSALGTDAPPVAGRLQRLLLPSFLPGPEAGPACLAQLLRGSPSAGRAFCAFLAGGGVCPLSLQALSSRHRSASLFCISKARLAHDINTCFDDATPTQTAPSTQTSGCRSNTTDNHVAGAEVPPEEVVALVVALRDHLLASAAGGPLGAAPAAEPLSKPACRKGGKRRGRTAAAAASEPVADMAVRTFSRHQQYRSARNPW